jgi:acetone carboxylase gamma subunit
MVSDQGQADGEATARRREQIRGQRRAWPVEQPSPAPGARNGTSSDDRERLLAIGEQLWIVAAPGGAVVRCDCGHELGPAQSNWKLHAARGALDPADLGPRIALHEELEIRGWACPGCGVLHSIEIARHDDGPLHEVEIDAGSLGGG